MDYQEMVKEIYKLELSPGDIIIVKTDGSFTNKMLENLKDSELNKFFVDKKVKMIVVPDDKISLNLIKYEKLVTDGINILSENDLVEVSKAKQVMGKIVSMFFDTISE